MALAEATELAALEKEAMEFFLEEEQREKEEQKQALRVQENRGKAFHEVATLHTCIHVPTCTNVCNGALYTIMLTLYASTLAV